MTDDTANSGETNADETGGGADTGGMSSGGVFIRRSAGGSRNASGISTGVCDDFPGHVERPRWPARYGIWALIAALGTTFVAAATGSISLPFVPLVFIEDHTVKDAVALFIGTAVLDSIFVLAAISFASVAQPLRLAQFGLRRVPLRRALSWMAVAVVIYLPFEIFWFSVVVEGAGQESTGGDPIAAIVLLGVAIVVMAPLAEEFLFRGFIYQAFRTRLGVLGAAALNGVLFGAMHIGTYAPLDVVPLAVFGFALCILFQRTSSLWPTVGLHALNNGFVFTLLLL